jgi:hypothetical protein
MYKKVLKGEIWNDVVTNKSKDGSLYYVDTFIRAVFDENGKLEGFTSIRQDITDIIIPYLGHRNDWNGYKFYPQFFNYKQLKIELNNGEIKIFNNSETIII